MSRLDAIPADRAAATPTFDFPVAPVRWLTLISSAEQSEWIRAEHDLIVASGGDPDRAALAAVHRTSGLDPRGAAALCVD